MQHLKTLVLVFTVVTLCGCDQAPQQPAKKSDPNAGGYGYDGTGVGAGASTGMGAGSSTYERSWRDRQADNPEFKKGEKFLDSKDFSTAILCYTKAIESDPKHYAAYYRRAYCIAREARDSDGYRRAIADYSVVVANAEECAFTKDGIYVSRACAYHNLGGGDDIQEKAVADCSEAIRINPKNAEAYYFRSLAKRRIAGVFGDESSADRDLAEARRIDPSVGK